MNSICWDTNLIEYLCRQEIHFTWKICEPLSERGLHCIILNYDVRLCYYINDISSNSRQTSKVWECIAMDSWYAFFKKCDSQASSPYTVVFPSTDTSKPPPSQPLSFPTVCADFQAAFLQQHMLILRNTIVCGDIYRSTIKTFHFLKKLHSVSTKLFAPQIGSQATDCFHFFTAAQLNIDIPISGLTLISTNAECAGFSLSGSHMWEKYHEFQIYEILPLYQLELCGAHTPHTTMHVLPWG